MQLVGRARIGLDLRVHLFDGGRVERANRREVHCEPAPQRDRVGTSVLELLVVEERVGAGREDLVREHRGLGGLGEVHRHGAVLDALEQRAQAVGVECFVQGVADGLAHEDVVGDLDGTGRVVLARRGLRKHRDHEVIGFHALDGRRVLPAVAEAEDHE